MHERTIGPFKGYFVAMYACEMGELGAQYLGFYKICAAEPESYWDAECLIKGSCASMAMAGQEALNWAEAHAKELIQRLPPRTELAAADERRPLYWFEIENLKQARL